MKYQMEWMQMTEHTRDANPDAALEAALAECAREPIRVPGAIQPHGVLLSVAGDPLCIEQVSANCAKSLGLESGELLGQPLSILLSPAHSMLINQAYSQPAMPNSDPIRLTVRAVDYSASLSRAGDVLIIELEAVVEAAHEQSRIITRVLRNLQAATTLETLFDIGVHEIQALTGYDRVMIYRFEPEGHGKVVAQALTGPLPSYSGLTSRVPTFPPRRESCIA
ncbi:Bacteriophytochrome [Pseudomonas avellanae]|uniref:Bacteriophytochrome n=1 Tax=Pseudomonas avellanae TaxID=46257 RepID=A0A3M5T6F0_9PSED|nr:Bacteriophytochrome [Pseudomonas avellanae]